MRPLLIIFLILPAILFPQKLVDTKKFFDDFFHVKEKGEYETTIEFNNRIKIDSTKTYIFQFKLRPIHYTTLYDADSNKLFIYLGNVTANNLNFIVREDEMPTQRYSGSNLFGVKKQVTLIQKKRYIIATKSDQGHLAENSGSPFISPLEYSCTPSVAKTLKNNLFMNIEISFSSYLDKQYSPVFENPTIENPIDKRTYFYYLYGIIKRLSIYTIEKKRTITLFNFTPVKE